MLILKNILLCSAALLQGQNLYIDAGGPGTGVYTSDKNFQGGFVNVDLSLGSPPWSTQRYGSNFSYVLPFPNGTYNVKIGMASPANPSASNRRFSIMVNGDSSPSLDLYTLVGPKQHYVYTRQVTVLAEAGEIVINFQATVGNALVNWISIEKAQPRQVSEFMPLQIGGVEYTLLHKPLVGSLLSVYEVGNGQPPYYLDKYLLHLDIIQPTPEPKKIILLNFGPNYTLFPGARLLYLYTTEE